MNHFKVESFVEKLKKKFNCEYLFGSFEGEVHEGSGIDLIKNLKSASLNVDDWKMISLPLEPLAYTKEEFEGIKEEPFIKEIMKYTVKL
ncbi:MAG: hypothetical protein ACTSUS_00105 [Candidatus Freyarchaeota archaeon]